MKSCACLLNKVFARVSCAALALLVVVFFAALGAALLPAFGGTATADSAGGAGAINAAGVVRAALFTVKQAACSTLIALALGFPAAFFLSQRKFAGERFLSALAAVPLAFPALLLAIGFVSVFGLNGAAVKLFSLTGARTAQMPYLYSFYGIIIAQGCYNFPYIMKNVSDAWEKLRGEERNAAILLGAGPFRVFRTITLVQLSPAILWSCVMVFLFCYFSFIIILLFGAPGTSTLEVEIFHAVRAASNIQAASALALAETAVALCVAALLTALQQNAEKSRGNSPWSEKKKIEGCAERIFFAALMCVIIIFLCLPVASVVVRGLNPRNLLPFIKSRGFFPALKMTVITSGIAAFLSVTAASAYVCALILSGSGGRGGPRRALRFFDTLPLAVSSIVMGLGMMTLVRRGNAAVYIIARSALLWPLAFKQIFPAVSRMPDDTLRAAKLFSPSLSDAAFGIVLPETRRAHLSAFAFCFAACAADASLPLMLAIPRFDTLALVTYRLAGSYRMGQACAAGTALIALCACVFVLADTAAVCRRGYGRDGQRLARPRGIPQRSFKRKAFPLKKEKS
ncbi:MAG: iron ABC transporter permease [Treponemataceae bacterium]|nr:MAG: iron ABC transporter permease [Treponemataceae bacterium]